LGIFSRLKRADTEAEIESGLRGTIRIRENQVEIGTVIGAELLAKDLLLRPVRLKACDRRIRQQALEAFYGVLMAAIRFNRLLRFASSANLDTSATR
jgi:hypothetical protein